MAFAPSGQQFEITRGDQSAVIVEVGGGIRAYSVGGRDVLEPYPKDELCDGVHGAPLIPWPNRLADGRYRFDGADYQVAITEPEKNNAIHGLLRWRPWRPVDQRSDGITMAAVLHPLRGYPFGLDLRIDYQLGPDGLTVTTTATNIGDRVAPYGSGQHPYLSPGAGAIDDCALRLGADTRILTDPVRKLPVAAEAVAGTAYDFRTGAVLGGLEIDHAYTDLHRDTQGRAWVHLTGPDGRTVQLWVDESYSLLQLFTGDTLAPGRRRRGLAAEPMTCPPNAFQSGDRVIRLEPGSATTATWGVSLVG